MSEIKHQLLSQAGHFSIGAAVMAPLAYGVFAVNPYALICGTGLAVAGVWLIVEREVRQFPSYRTSTGWWAKVGGWDPWLDASFWLLGMAMPWVVLALI